MLLADGQIDPREPTRDDSVAIGTTAVMVSDPRTGKNYREELILRNISDDATKIISIHTGSQIATANTGIVLRQYEAVVWSRIGDDFPPQGAITAICAVAGGTLAVHER